MTYWLQEVKRKRLPPWRSFWLSPSMYRVGFILSCPMFPTLRKFLLKFPIISLISFGFCWAEGNLYLLADSSWPLDARTTTWALIPICNIPNPSIGEEDATMPLANWETSPINMCIHRKWNKMLWSKDAYMVIIQRKKTHTSKHSTCSS